jgi:hypothetical protein
MKKERKEGRKEGRKQASKQASECYHLTLATTAIPIKK